MNAVQCEIDNGALLKILLHAAKFPGSSIDGLLIGFGDADSVHVTDSIPLFHTVLSLAPQFEIALALVEERLKGEKDEIVGVYVCDAHYSKNDFDSASKTIGNRIAAMTSSPAALGLVFDNTELHAMMQGEDVLPCRVSDDDDVYGRRSGDGNEEWRECSDVITQGAGSIRSLFVDMLDRGVHRQLHDFDEHLDNVQLSS